MEMRKNGKFPKTGVLGTQLEDFEQFNQRKKKSVIIRIFFFFNEKKNLFGKELSVSI